MNTLNFPKIGNLLGRIGKLTFLKRQHKNRELSSKDIDIF